DGQGSQVPYALVMDTSKTIRANFTQVGSECSDGWMPISDPGGPTPREGSAAINDPLRRRMIVFGGTTSLPGQGGPICPNDLYALALGAHTWSTLTPTGAPPSPRYLSQAV